MSPATPRNEQAKLNPATLDMLRQIATKKRESIGDVVDRLALDAIRAEYSAIIREAAAALESTPSGA